MIVDEKGQVVDGDQLLAVIASDWQDEGRLSRPGLVSTVMSNLGLERYVTARGLQLHRTAVGDRHVLEAMREHGFNLGGEQSGHIICADYTTTGDGLVAALQVLDAVKRANKPVSEVCHCFEPVPQLLKNMRGKRAQSLEDKQVIASIKAAEDLLKGTGRVLVRPSGTEAMIRVMAEGDDAERVHEAVEMICAALDASHIVAA